MAHRAFKKIARCPQKMKSKVLTITDYTSVLALIKWAKKNKKKVEVERLGDEYNGFYYKVKLK